MTFIGSTVERKKSKQIEMCTMSRNEIERANEYKLIRVCKCRARMLKSNRSLLCIFFIYFISSRIYANGINGQIKTHSIHKQHSLIHVLNTKHIVTYTTFINNSFSPLSLSLTYFFFFGFWYVILVWLLLLVVSVLFLLINKRLERAAFANVCTGHLYLCTTWTHIDDYMALQYG